jgi:hypothetical protein
MYKIYHRQPLYPGLVFSDQERLPADTLDWPASYQEAAQVEAESLEEAYIKTQHLETAWWHNRGVKATQMSRSTSVGDVIQDEQGAFWAVAATGFIRISEQHEKAP